ncbi:MAG: hypothetical protein KAZ88_11410 [Acidimicrobiia bacterium]|nr:hypothetical protein [Acidimicrobiia bacterium]MBP8181587.1 hypothetical protein [Acidimicrobiia bacterium]
MVGQLQRRARMVGHRFLVALGVCAIPIGILAPLSPDWWDGKWWLVLLVAAGAAGWAFLGLRRRQPTQTYAENVTIRLVVGDLFEQNASAIIGMTTTFDSAVPEVIAASSVQGHFLQKVYAGSQATLDQDLEAALAHVSPVGTIVKPGKEAIYPLGTAITLPITAQLRYYCAAYSDMDQQNRATGSIRGVLDGLENSWDQIDAYGNGEPICVPLIGQGQSRIPELTAEISVRLMAFSFLLRSKRSRFSSELRIVIHPSEQHKVDPVEFQSFLSSLAA